MKAQAIEECFQRWSSHMPHPTTELVYRNHFELLICVILSAQATDVSVNKATLPLFAKHPTPQAFIELGEQGLAHAIKSIGLYRTKAKNIIQTCHRLVSEHNSQVPEQRAALEALPGVGRKTANVVLNTAFGQPTMAVDTHIFRVANRTQIGAGKTVLAVEKALLNNIPKPYLVDAHHWLILHGRYTCKARKPNCSGCLIADLCPYEPKTQPSSKSTSKNV